MTINDVILIFTVVVVKRFCLKSQIDSSTMNAIVAVGPRVNIRSPQRGILFVFASKRLLINF
jgi:hypothetical protein